jgi:hypothetical protein
VICVQIKIYMQGVQQRLGEINATDRIEEQSWLNIVVKLREAMTSFEGFTVIHNDRLR